MRSEWRYKLWMIGHTFIYLDGKLKGNSPVKVAKDLRNGSIYRNATQNGSEHIQDFSRHLTDAFGIWSLAQVLLQTVSLSFRNIFNSLFLSTVRLAMQVWRYLQTVVVWHGAVASTISSHGNGCTVCRNEEV